MNFVGDWRIFLDTNVTCHMSRVYYYGDQQLCISSIY